MDIRGSFEDLIVQHIEITGRRRREDRDDYNRSLGIKRALNRSQEQSAIKLDGRNFRPAQAGGAGAMGRRHREKLVGLLSHLQFKIVKSEMQVCLFQREL